MHHFTRCFSWGLFFTYNTSKKLEQFNFKPYISKLFYAWTLSWSILLNKGTCCSWGSILIVLLYLIKEETINFTQNLALKIFFRRQVYNITDQVSISSPEDLCHSAKVAYHSFWYRKWHACTVFCQVLKQVDSRRLLFPIQSDMRFVFHWEHTGRQWLTY